MGPQSSLVSQSQKPCTGVIPSPMDQGLREEMRQALTHKSQEHTYLVRHLLKCLQQEMGPRTSPGEVAPSRKSISMRPHQSDFPWDMLLLFSQSPKFTTFSGSSPVRLLAVRSPPWSVLSLMLFGSSNSCSTPKSSLPFQRAIPSSWS